MTVLRDEFPELMSEVRAANRVFWVGSGVSRSRVPQTYKLLGTLFTELKRRSIEGPDSAAHLDALAQIAEDFLDFGERQLAKLRADPNLFSIPNKQKLSKLASRYSEILEVEVGNHDSDYLLWDLIDVRETYGSPRHDPAPDHYFIGMLAMMGLVPAVVTTNWDGLLESALKRLAGNARPVLQVVVENNDIRSANGNAPYLIKLHGCAVLARNDPSAYRERIVARREQLTRVPLEPWSHEMYREVTRWLRQKRTLFLGISVQDHDLLGNIVNAGNAYPWAWDSSSPAYLFAEKSAQSDHKIALKTIYGPSHAEIGEITKRSCLKMFSGPALGALVVDAIEAHLIEAVGRTSSPFTDDREIERGLKTIVKLFTSQIGKDYQELADSLRYGFAGVVALFTGYPDDRVSGQWADLNADGLHREGGLDAVARFLGLLAGTATDLRIELGSDVSQPTNLGTLVLRKTSPGTSLAPRVVLTKDEVTYDRLLQAGLLSGEDEHLLVVFAKRNRSSVARSTGSKLGTGRRQLTSRYEVSFGEIAECATANKTTLAAGLRELGRV